VSLRKGRHAPAPRFAPERFSELHGWDRTAVLDAGEVFGLDVFGLVSLAARVPGTPAAILGDEASRAQLVRNMDELLSRV